MSEHPAVETRELTHHYGARQALEGVSFSVRAGEIFGVLAPNGGGKSTLFRILATLLPPTRGLARVLGENVHEQPVAIRKRIGVVFQSPSLDRKLTARENLLHQGHLYGLRGAELRRRIGDVLNRFGVADRADERVEQLSGGLRRRVELAKGFLHGPELLLLDEPSAALDPGARHEFWDYLAAVRDQVGVTILLTTHWMEEAERCDRLAVLHQGRLVAVGPPASLKNSLKGDVIVLECKDPEKLKREIQEKFGVRPTVLGRTVRVERPRGHEFIGQVLEAFPDEIEAVKVSRPTLEDVFIHHTGFRFADPDKSALP